MALVAGMGLLAGCAGAPRPAAADRERLTPEEERERAVLDAGERAEVLAAFASLVPAGYEPVDPPHAPADGVAWSDVPAAARDACNDVEMAIVRTDETDGRFDFTLKTVEDWPARLVVVRGDTPETWSVDAAVGRFPNEPARVARAEALVEAFWLHLREWGRKRR